MKNKAKILFDIVDSIGEGDYETYTIIDITESYVSSQDVEQAYGIYSSKGHRFNVTKEDIDIEDFVAEYGECDGFEREDGAYYDFLSNPFEGFKDLSIDAAIKLFK